MDNAVRVKETLQYELCRRNSDMISRMKRKMIFTYIDFLLNLKYLYRIVKWYWIKWYSNILYINFHSLLKRKSICFPKWLFRSTAHIGNYCPSHYLPANLLSKTNYSNKWKSGKITGSHHMNHASSSYQWVEDEIVRGRPVILLLFVLGVKYVDHIKDIFGYEFGKSSIGWLNEWWNSSNRHTRCSLSFVIMLLRV